MTATYDPDVDVWLLTLTRALKDYVSDGFNSLSSSGNGLDAYDVVFGYPDSSDPLFQAELVKTIIHLEVDDITDIPLGFGDNMVNEIIAPVSGNIFQTTQEEALCKLVNFDVGVWASYQSGGSTSRMVAYQVLSKLFTGAGAFSNAKEAMGGVEIRSFQSGLFVVDAAGDINVFRIVGSDLIVRVYVKRVSGPYQGVDTIHLIQKVDIDQTQITEVTDIQLHE